MLRGVGVRKCNNEDVDAATASKNRRQGKHVFKLSLPQICAALVMCILLKLEQLLEGRGQS